MTTQPVHPHAPSLGRDDSGTIRIGDTRVTFDSVVTAFWRGATPEEIMSRFDVLTLPQIYGAISYYLTHREEVDAYLEQQREDAEKLRRKLEAAGITPNGADVRERLLRRKEAAEREHDVTQKGRAEEK
jgi:uncharacterized protein (DUF433 family)